MVPEARSFLNDIWGDASCTFGLLDDVMLSHGGANGAESVVDVMFSWARQVAASGDGCTRHAGDSLISQLPYYCVAAPIQIAMLLWLIFNCKQYRRVKYENHSQILLVNWVQDCWGWELYFHLCVDWTCLTALLPYCLTCWMLLLTHWLTSIYNGDKFLVHSSVIVIFTKMRAIKVASAETHSLDEGITPLATVSQKLGYGPPGPYGSCAYDWTIAFCTETSWLRA